MTITTMIVLCLIGFAAGLLSGLVGVGGGIIIVPALVFFLGFTQQQAQGNSLGLLLLPVGAFAVYNYYQRNMIDTKVIAAMLVGFLLGGWLGSKVAFMLSEEMTKKLFAALLIFTAIKMLRWDALFFTCMTKIIGQ